MDAQPSAITSSPSRERIARFIEDSIGFVLDKLDSSLAEMTAQLDQARAEIAAKDVELNRLYEGLVKSDLADPILALRAKRATKAYRVPAVAKSGEIRLSYLAPRAAIEEAIRAVEAAHPGCIPTRDPAALAGRVDDLLYRLERLALATGLTWDGIKACGMAYEEQPDDSKRKSMFDTSDKPSPRVVVELTGSRVVIKAEKYVHGNTIHLVMALGGDVP